MRKILAFAILLSCCLSCRELDCTILEEPSIGGAFVLNELSSIEWEGLLLQLEVASASHSYVLAEDEAGDFIHMLRTRDGGLTWDTLNFPGEYRGEDLLFVEEEVGIVSYFNSNASLLRTIDGGQTWEDLIFPELEGRLYDLSKDEAGNIYGIVSKIGADLKMVKSTDQGQSWEVLRTHPELGTSGTWVNGALLYTALDYQTLMVTDLDGQNPFLVELNSSIGNLRDVYVVDRNNIIMTGFIRSVKTNDGGETWTGIHAEEAWVIDFNLSGEGMMVLNQGYCGDNPIEHGVLGHTENDGATWTTGQNTEYLMDRYVGSHKLAQDDYRILIGNKYYRITR